MTLAANPARSGQRRCLLHAPRKPVRACLLILPRPSTRRILREATCPTSLVARGRGGARPVPGPPARRAGPECRPPSQLRERPAPLRRLVRAFLGRGAGPIAAFDASGDQHPDPHLVPLLSAGRARPAA